MSINDIVQINLPGSVFNNCQGKIVWTRKEMYGVVITLWTPEARRMVKYFDVGRPLGLPIQSLKGVDNAAYASSFVRN